MQNCDHELIEMKKTAGKGKKPASVLMVCAYCGHRRIVWEDGTVQIIQHIGRVESFGHAAE